MDSVEAVEKILNYSFVNKTLLKEALTKTSISCDESSSLFERLEFLGDSVLEVAFTNYIHHNYPNLKLNELRVLRAANVSNEKFARVAVNHHLYQFLLRQNPSFRSKMAKKVLFTEAVSKEDDPVPYGGLVKAPKVLADLVESIAGAVYIDVNYDVQRLWEIFGGLLEPIYTPDDLRLQPKPPFLTLFRLADKHGKQIDFRYSKDDNRKRNIAEVYLDDIFIASGCAKSIDYAKLLAAEGALEKLSELEDVKQKLIEICSTEKLRLQTGLSSVPTASENPLTYEMTPNKKVIDQDSLHIEPEDVKRKLIEICSAEKLRLQTRTSSLPTVYEKPLTYDLTPNKMVIDEDSLHVEPGDVKGNLLEICSTKKLQGMTGSSSLPTTSEPPLTDEMIEEQMVIDEESPHVEPEHVKGNLLEICSTEKLQGLTGSSSLPTTSETPLTDEMTEEQMVIYEESPHVEPEHVKGNLLEICSTEKLQRQTGSSSLPTTENLLTDEITEEQMVIDEDSPHVEPEDAKGKLFEIFSSRKLQIQTGSSSLPTASVNSLTYEMTTKQMVVDKDSLHVEPEDVKGKLFEICTKNKWPRPIFSVEEERGVKNELKFVCSVRIEIPTIDGTFHMKGDAKSKKKQAENSSAYHMIRALKSSLMSLVISNLQMPKILDKKKNPSLFSSEIDSDSVEAVEKILNYIFTNKNLLKEALSQTSSLFERLMFVGEAALDLAFTNHIYVMYPKLEPREMNLLRMANTSTKTYARVAVKHNIYQFFIREVEFDEKIKAFSEVVGKEDDPFPSYGGRKPPKVLSDLVQSVAGAVYIDMNFDVKRLWEIFWSLFKPLYTLDDLRLRPQPLRTLFCLGDKHGKHFDFRYKENSYKRTTKAYVYLDDKLIAYGKNKTTRDAAKMSAAMEALNKLSESMPVEIVMDANRLDIEIEDAKEKLIEICNKRKWPNPVYRVENNAISRGFVCSAQIETPTEEGTLYVKGDKRKLRKTAENNSASHMLRALEFSPLDDL